MQTREEDQGLRGRLGSPADPVSGGLHGKVTPTPRPPPPAGSLGTVSPPQLFPPPHTQPVLGAVPAPACVCRPLDRDRGRHPRCVGPEGDTVVAGPQEGHCQAEERRGGDAAVAAGRDRSSSGDGVGKTQAWKRRESRVRAQGRPGGAQPPLGLSSAQKPGNSGPERAAGCRACTRPSPGR